MDNYTLTIIVDGGNFFEGSLGQWEDCFFSFPDDFSMNDKIAQIQDYCIKEGMDLVFSFKNMENKDNKVNSLFQ
jgi:hypothetical protein